MSLVGCLNEKPRFRIIFRDGQSIVDPVNIIAAFMIAFMKKENCSPITSMGHIIRTYHGIL